MSLFRRANGRFIKESHYQRNQNAHRDKKLRDNITACSIDHGYAAVVPSSTQNLGQSEPDIASPNIHSEECVADEDFVLTDTNKDYIGGHWQDSRVVVDLDVFFRALNCKQCSLPLDPNKCIGLHPEGITGYLYIPCSNPACNKVNRVPLAKSHKQAVKGPSIFDVNSKLPLGKYNYM